MYFSEIKLFGVTLTVLGLHRFVPKFCLKYPSNRPRHYLPSRGVKFSTTETVHWYIGDSEVELTGVLSLF